MPQMQFFSPEGKSLGSFNLKNRKNTINLFDIVDNEIIVADQIRA